MSNDGLNPEEIRGDEPLDLNGTAAEFPRDAQSDPGETPESADSATQAEAMVAELEQAKEDLARARADLYNLQQEYGNYVRRTKTEGAAHRQTGQEEVVESLLGLLDDVAAAREAGDLEDGPFASMAAKLEDILSTRFGLERYGLEGEDFDPQLHEALMVQTNPQIEHPLIKQVLQPGYRMKDRVLRATKVMVDNPE